ncbi:MAG: oligoendopeptidase F [Planctomycetes bacterium]|nr:oligoendopeptidase F [Planctomycetota bacterium]
MNRFSSAFTVSLALLALSNQQGVAQTRDRSQVDPKYQWQLKDIYPTLEAWSRAKDGLASTFDGVLQYRGQLSKSAGQLADCLEFGTHISKELTRLYCYASMQSDLDTRDSKTLSLRQQVEQMITEYNAKASFVEPEIVAMNESLLEEFCSQEDRLTIHRMYLDNLQRTKAHKLSGPEEKILAEAGRLARGPSTIFSIFSNAELPYPTVTLSDGQEALLDKAGYARYRAVENRADREVVFQAFWRAFEGFKQTFGTQLYAQVQKDIFFSHVRHYDSCLHSALDSDNVPVAVYHSLIDHVNENLATFHRYLRLKARMLGVSQLKYSDLYAPVVKDVDLTYSYDEAVALVLDAIKPLGDEYARVARQGMTSRWIDVYPSLGKRSGAYSNGGCYDVHPYILLNYNDRFEDVSTLAHELGHTLHSHLSNKTQPYATADYSIFVAEVASTLNEALLIHKMLGQIKQDEVRLSLLMNYLDGIKGTVFRQTQFAEYELRMHEMAEKGTPLTGDSLTELYGEILNKYYGHDQGVCVVDDLYHMEWAYIPHFYYNFYVFQYATSFTASTALSEKIINHEPGAVDRVLAFLSSGGSDYPINILKKAGVDMTQAEPFEKTMAAMNRTMDEIETILNKK